MRGLVPRRKSFFDFDPFSRGPDVFDRLMRPISLVEDVFSHYANPSETGITMAPINVEKTDGGLRVIMAAPGLKESDFDLEVKGNQLIISAESSDEVSSEEDQDKFSWREYNYSNVTRTVPLPKGVMADQVTAQYKDGELTVEIPTGEVQDSIKIPVSTKQIAADSK